MKKKVLVVGSRGFIGKHLVEELNRKRYDVIEFDKKISPNQNTLYFDELPNCDYCINLAGLVGLKYCLENPINGIYNNIIGPTRLFEALKHTDIKLIHISTWAVEGNLINPYDITKLAGEKLALSYIKQDYFPGCIARLGTTYGPGMSKLGVIPSMIKKLKENKPLIIFGRGSQIRQFTFVKDTINGIITIMEKGHNKEIYNVVSDEITSIRDIAEYLGGKIEYKSARIGDEKYKIIDNNDLKKLGWKQKISFKKGMELMKNE